MDKSSPPAAMQSFLIVFGANLLKLDLASYPQVSAAKLQEILELQSIDYRFL